MVSKILKNKQALIGLVLILLFVSCALFAPYIAPNDPDKVDVLNKFRTSDSDYPLGADQLGRCELSRLLFGARRSLMIAVPSLAAIGFIGTILGTAAAFFGKWFERAFLFICDVLWLSRRL